MTVRVDMISDTSLIVITKQSILTLPSWLEGDKGREDSSSPSLSCKEEKIIT